MNDRYLIIKEKYYIDHSPHYFTSVYIFYIKLNADTIHEFPVRVKDSLFMYICNFLSKHES